MTALLLQWRSLLLQARSPKTGHTITLVWPLCYWAVSLIASKVPDETTRKVAGETSPLIIVSTHTSLPSSFHLAPSIIISTHLLSSSPTPQFLQKIRNRYESIGDTSRLNKVPLGSSRRAVARYWYRYIDKSDLFRWVIFWDIRNFQIYSGT